MKEANIGPNGPQDELCFGWDFLADGMVLTKPAQGRLDDYLVEYCEATYGRILDESNVVGSEERAAAFEAHYCFAVRNGFAVRVRCNHLEELCDRICVFVLDPRNHLMTLGPSEFQRKLGVWTKNHLAEIDPAIRDDPLGNFPRN